MDMFGGRGRWRGELEKNRLEGTNGPKVFALLRALVILMFGVLVIQLINLQIIQGGEFRDQAQINALREIDIPAARGLIYDRNGTLLVLNEAEFAAAIVPSDLPDLGQTAVYRLLANVIDVDATEIESLVIAGIERQGEFNPVIIKDRLDRETALILMELEPHAPGMRVMVSPSREYLTGSLLSHVLGYVGPISAEEFEELSADRYNPQDFIGKNGVELEYESALRGKPGKRLIKVDAAGRELEVISERLPIDGSNLVLTIDIDLQREVARVLELHAGDSDNAAAAVMDIKTGEVLAMVSMPSFDNNVFDSVLSSAELAALIEAPGKPLVNHVMAERYPPGSTFKTIVGAAALEEGVATTATTITSRGYITIENEFDPNVLYIYPDWTELGVLDFYDGLAMSSNVYFYYLAGGYPDEGFRGLGEERVAAYARAFGLGSPTGIDLPGESSGLVPDATWKSDTFNEPWTLGDTYNFAIGQGYLAATPLQMLTAIASIGNGGQLLTPHVVKEFIDSHGNVLQEIAAGPRTTVPVSAAYLKAVTTGMLQSVTDGVASPAAVKGLSIAGKTGTAEFGPVRDDGTLETHGWFVGFAPYDEPEIAIVVFVQRGSGGSNASPAASQIFDYYFNAPRLTRAEISE